MDEQNTFSDRTQNHEMNGDVVLKKVEIISIFIKKQKKKHIFAKLIKSSVVPMSLWVNIKTSSDNQSFIQIILILNLSL